MDIMFYKREGEEVIKKTNEGAKRACYKTERRLEGSSDQESYSLIFIDENIILQSEPNE